jgi:hypothetical protein
VKEAEQNEFMARQAARDAEAAAKTAKNRAKRQKRKHGKKGDNEGTANGGGGGGGPGEPKRKLAGGGAGVLVGGQAHEGESEEEGPVVPVVETKVVPAAPVVAQQSEIIIHDDD